MPLDIKRLDARRFDASKMQKVNQFEPPRFFLDVYCLEPGRRRRPHRHDDADNVHAVPEGDVLVRVSSDTGCSTSAAC